MTCCARNFEKKTKKKLKRIGKEMDRTKKCRKSNVTF